MTKHSSRPASGPSSAAVRQRLTAELGLPSRLGHTALLLAGLASATVTVSLLLGEEALPVRTRIAFVVLTVIGAAWAGFAAWVLARRRVLFALHRLIAARMAVAFTAVFTTGALLLADNFGSSSAIPVCVGAILLGLALLQHARARRQVARLLDRREELERQLATGATNGM